MPTFATTGSPTANLIGAPTAAVSSGAASLLAAEAAAQGLPSITGQSLSWYETRLATVLAEAYAAGGGNYALAYAEAYAAVGAAFAQALVLFNEGQYGTFGGTAWGTYGYFAGTNPNTSQATYIGLSLNLPVPGEAAGADPRPPGGIDLPAFGTPGAPSEETGETRAAAATDQAPVVSPPSALTLADQMEAVPRARTTATPGAGVVPPLRRQMRKFEKRRRR